MPRAWRTCKRREGGRGGGGWRGGGGTRVSTGEAFFLYDPRRWGHVPRTTTCSSFPCHALSGPDPAAAAGEALVWAHVKDLDTKHGYLYDGAA